MKFLARIMVALLAVVMVAGVVPAAAQDAQTPDEICASTETSEPETRQFDQAEQVLEAGVDYRAILCTEFGAVYVDLFEQTAPITVNNFVFLAQQNFYNNSIFHRVIADFMAQAGDPVGNPPGTGGPGYEFEDEFVGYLNFDRPGLLAMANANRPEQGIVGTNGSQFFITTVVTDWLNQRHTIFGEVLEGQDVVESIPDNQSDPNIQTKLNSVVIITDPATVASDAQPSAPATQEDVDAAIAALPQTAPALLGPGLITGEENGILTTEERIAAAPEGAQLALQSYYDAHTPDYHAAATIVNETCDLQTIPIADMSNWVDAYATVEDAAAAISPDDFAAIAEGMGLQEVESDYATRTIYAGTVSGCDNDALVRAMSFQQIGHFVVTSIITFDPTNLGANNVSMEDAAALLLTNLNDPAFGSFLGDVFRPEVH